MIGLLNWSFDCMSKIFFISVELERLTSYPYYISDATGKSSKIKNITTEKEKRQRGGKRCAMDSEWIVSKGN